MKKVDLYQINKYKHSSQFCWKKLDENKHFTILIKQLIPKSIIPAPSPQEKKKLKPALSTAFKNKIKMTQKFTKPRISKNPLKLSTEEPEQFFKAELLNYG